MYVQSVIDTSSVWSSATFSFIVIFHMFAEVNDSPYSFIRLLRQLITQPGVTLDQIMVSVDGPEYLETIKLVDLLGLKYQVHQPEGEWTPRISRWGEAPICPRLPGAAEEKNETITGYYSTPFHASVYTITVPLVLWFEMNVWDYTLMVCTQWEVGVWKPILQLLLMMEICYFDFLKMCLYSIWIYHAVM